MVELLAFVLLMTPANVTAHLDDGDADNAPACVRTSVINAGQQAPCSGLLFSVGQARQALTCVKADLPQCKADHAKSVAYLSAERDSLSVQLQAYKAVANSVEPPSVWPVVITGSAGVAVGVLLGFVFAGGL